MKNWKIYSCHVNIVNANVAFLNDVKMQLGCVESVLYILYIFLILNASCSTIFQTGFN